MPVCRAYRPDDRAACVDLLRRGHDPRFDAARFHWLHAAGPGGPSRIVVCEDAGRIVGTSAVIPRPALLDGRPCRAGRDVDPVVDPAYRGQGLFSQMLDWLLAHLDGIEVLYNFANPASAPGFRRRGWREAGRLRDRVCQLGFERPLSREHLLYLATYPWARTRAAGEIREIAPGDLARLAGEPLPPPGRRFAVRRTPAYLAWRYGAHPIHTYRAFAREVDGVVQEVVVVRHQPDRGALVIMDVAAFAPGAGKLGPYLPRLRREFGGAWACVWSGVPAAWNCGFVVSPRSAGQPVLMRAAPGRQEPELDGAALFITHGDVEAS